jgi:16S rRNA processing protein RimM
MRKLSPYLAVGQVLKPQGIHGEVKVKPLTDDPERFFSLSTVYFEGKDKNMQPHAFKTVRVHGGFVYAVIDDTGDRNGAEALRGKLLHVARADAVPLPKGRYFIVDLIGCDIVDSKGSLRGTLKEIIQTGANDVYVIEGKTGQWMLPALPHVLLDTDIDKGVITVDESALLEVDRGAY